jgi:hypothetical protein
MIIKSGGTHKVVRVPEQHAMETSKAIFKEKVHLVVSPAFDGGERSLSHTGYFIPVERILRSTGEQPQLV